MNLEIHSHLGIGSIRLGMSRSAVRDLIGEPVTTFQKDLEEGPPTDAFNALGVHVYYDADDNCEAIEVFAPSTPRFRGEYLISRPFSEVLSWLKSIDTAVEVDGCGATSIPLGLAVYARAAIKRPDDPVEAVIVFRRGYYDQP